MNIPKKYLTEQVILVEARIDNMSILRILTQNKQINKADPNYNYYVQLANWANSKQEKTGEIDLTTIKLSDNSLVQKGKLAKNTKHLGATLEQLKNLMDQEGKYNSESELSNLIQKTTLEILAGLSGIKNPKPEAEPEAEPEEELDTEPKSDPKVKSGGGRDWTAYRAKKLASANGNTAKALNEFYDEYYSQEFAGVESPEKDTKGIVTKLKSLDKILIPEFNKLGYNPEVNPFASFLKILIKKESDIFDKLTYNTYGAIHNSFIDKDITGNMLGQKFDETNILFCSDLYNKNGLDIVNYLDLQNQALAAGENSDIENLVAKIFIQQDVSDTTYSEKINNLKNLKEPTLPGAPEAKLRSELEIRELYRHLFGAEAKKVLSDKIMQAIAVKVADNGATFDMVNYLLTLVSTRALNPAKVAHYTEVSNELKQQSYKKNEVLYNWSKEQLSSYSLEDDKKAMDLAVKLISVYNTKRQSENKKDDK